MIQRFCDICYRDITKEDDASIYRMLLDRDMAPFSAAMDIADVCSDCAQQIHDYIHQMRVDKGGIVPQ